MLEVGTYGISGRGSFGSGSSLNSGSGGRLNGSGGGLGGGNDGLGLSFGRHFDVVERVVCE